jgi:peptidoglycan/xylan/chitin deacetylase (PgdA/CDA1 family)
MSLRVIQWWDDGVVDDIRLTELLRRYDATATFSLNPGLYRKTRTFGWTHGNKEIWRLGIHELVNVYDGFDIASHSLTHPNLTAVPPDVLYREVTESRTILEDLFERSINGFCYPFDAYNDSVIHAVESAGYRFARGDRPGCIDFPPGDPFLFHPSCHFLSSHFWTLYETAKMNGTVFFFWGHSYELINDDMWKHFERTLEKISSDREAMWASIPPLFRENPDDVPPEKRKI